MNAQLASRGSSIEGACAGCGAAIITEVAVVTCADCTRRFHPGCWEAIGRCPTCGHPRRAAAGPRAAVPEPPSPSRRWGALLGAPLWLTAERVAEGRALDAAALEAEAAATIGISGPGRALANSLVWRAAERDRHIGVRASPVGERTWIVVEEDLHPLAGRLYGVVGLVGGLASLAVFFATSHLTAFDRFGVAGAILGASWFVGRTVFARSARTRGEQVAALLDRLAARAAG